MAARSLGASRPRAFLTVTLPQIRFAVVTGAILAFLTSFDEIIVAMFVSGGANSTLTRNMFVSLRDQIDPTIAANSILRRSCDVGRQSAEASSANVSNRPRTPSL